MSLFESKLDELISSGELVEVFRDRLTTEPLIGRVLQRSQHVLVMEKLDDVYRTNGVAAIRPSDITRLKRGGAELSAAATVARLSDEALTIPEIGLLEISSAITLFQQRFGHVSLYVEALDPTVCFIGEYLDLDDDFVLLRQFGTFRSRARSELLLALEQVTRVDAGGYYERLLPGVASD